MVIALGPEFVRAELGHAEGAWYGLMTVVGVGLLLGIVAAPALLVRLDAARIVAVGLVGLRPQPLLGSAIAAAVGLVRHSEHDG